MKGWKLVLDGKKTITRRIKPEPVGAIRAVCPTRGMAQVCKIMIISCIPHRDWFAMYWNNPRALRAEAKREGFGSWEGLMAWFDMKYGGIPEGLYRIEFRKLPGGKPAKAKYIHLGHI